MCLARLARAYPPKVNGRCGWWQLEMIKGRYARRGRVWMRRRLRVRRHEPAVLQPSHVKGMEGGSFGRQLAPDLVGRAQRLSQDSTAEAGKAWRGIAADAARLEWKHL